MYRTCLKKSPSQFSKTVPSQTAEITAESLQKIGATATEGDHPHRTGTDKDQTAETDITAVETGTETEAVPEGEAIQEVGEIADLKEKIRNVKLCVGNATKKGIINQNADRI